MLFISKGLGDYTNGLPKTLAVGAEATMEGPYGRFTFEDGQARQVWIGGGLGIAPFISRMKHVAKTPGANAIDLFHSTKEVSPQALGFLKATAADAGVALHVWVDHQDGFLTGERLRKLVPH